LISIFAAKPEMLVKGKDGGNGKLRGQDREIKVEVAGCPFLIHTEREKRSWHFAIEIYRMNSSETGVGRADFLRPI
jgi:hypothetical protein